MKILVTGSKGFIAKNLIAELNNRGYKDLMLFDKDSSESSFEKYLREADFIYHFAGVNRTNNDKDYYEVNTLLIDKMINLLSRFKNRCPILLTSSIHVDRGDVYGKSKKMGEDKLIEYAKENNIRLMIYRLPNVFGKWSKPNYNSVVATFCNNISRNISISIKEPDALLNLAYIDDVIQEFINALKANKSTEKIYYDISKIYKRKLVDVANLIKSFKDSRKNLLIPNMADEFTKKLYSTYLSYLPLEEFAYDLEVNKDKRGTFTEFVRLHDGSQVSINISKPGVIKGNHWHHTKVEKFLVIKGEGIIRFRNIYSDKIIEYHVSALNQKIVDIPSGYTHSMQNIGDTDMITLMWCNEHYNPEKPDTYPMEVQIDEEI